MSTADWAAWNEAARTQPTTIYVDVAEAAKLIRATLKHAFPKTKFRVRSERYAGGSSVSIHWIDGPTTHQVERLMWQYRGASFDGMIDMQSDIYHEGPNGERLHYGSDYITCQRGYSRHTLDMLAGWVCATYGLDIEYEIRESGDPTFGCFIASQDNWIPAINGYLNQKVWRHAQYYSLDGTLTEHDRDPFDLNA